MNSKFFSRISHCIFGVAVATIIVVVLEPDIKNATITNGVLMFLTSFVGFGVARYYEVTETSEINKNT